MFHDDVPIIGEAGAAGSDDGQPGDPADAARRERDELNDRLLRTAAEFDNYRKRTERERRDWSDAAAMDVIRDVLPVLDDLERALAAQDTSADGVLRKGVEMIRQKLAQTLERRGVRPIETVGHMFNPNLHEAIGHEPAPGHPDDEVIAELQRGYTLRDRLVRAAIVKVAKS